MVQVAVAEAPGQLRPWHLEVKALNESGGFDHARIKWRGGGLGARLVHQIPSPRLYKIKVKSGRRTCKSGPGTEWVCPAGLRHGIMELGDTEAQYRPSTLRSGGGVGIPRPAR